MSARDWDGPACVWWLSQGDCELIRTLDDGPSSISYLREQFDNLYGRNGRGRLWVPEELEGRGLEVPERFFAGPVEGAVMKCGGIVMLREDLPRIARLPGLVTDFELRRV